MPRPKTISDEELLAAARDRFLADGVGASTRAIARDLGISEGVLFQRFESKEGLFFRAMKLPAPQLDRALAKARSARELESGLLDLTLAAFTYLNRSMPVVLLVLAHPGSRTRLRPGTSQAAELLAEAVGIQRVLRQFFQERIDAGKLADQDLAPTITLLVSALLTRALHEHVGFTEARGRKKWLRALIARLADGFRAE